LVKLFDEMLRDQRVAEVVQQRALLPPDPASARAQTEGEMEALRDVLVSLLAQKPDRPQ